MEAELAAAPRSERLEVARSGTRLLFQALKDLERALRRGGGRAVAAQPTEARR